MNEWADDDFSDSHFHVVNSDGDEVARFRRLADAIHRAEVEGGCWVRLTAAADWEGPQVWPIDESGFDHDHLSRQWTEHLWIPSRETVTGTLTRIEVPPGTYFIGDPVYATKRSLWREALESDPGFVGPMMSTSAGPFILFPLGMDGSCWDVDGNRYAVDSASLGLVASPLWGESFDIDRLERLGRIVTFDSDQEVIFYPGGLIRFGHVVVDVS